jgi:gamma-glutamyltranspeptidase/glutathione hydrolase
MPAFADFLDYMSREGKDAFYRGEVAGKIIHGQVESGFLTRQDLEEYRVLIRKPLTFDYHGKIVHTNPLPSIGGTLMAHYLKHLSMETLSEQAGDQTFVQNLFRALARCESLDRRPEALGLSLSYLLSNKKHGSTTHFNVVDKWGNAIALTATNGEGCGSFVEGTDIQLNNMLGEAALLPDGFHTWTPDVRLSSMMSPTIVTDLSGALEVVTGTGGASRIPSAITQTLHYLLDYHYSVEQAVNAPRVHLGHGVFNVEPGFDHNLSVGDFKEELKLWNEQSLFFGGVHTIVSRNGSLYASGDERRDGVVRMQ